MRTMIRTALIGAMVVGAAGVIQAHVTVAPRQSPGGASERYTMTVPTEGQVATTSVELEIPANVTVTDIVEGTAYTFDARRVNGKIVAITWTQTIPPGARAQFVFVARNPASGPIAWKARQRLADGTSEDWVGVAGDRRPAAVTTLTAGR